MVGTSGPWFRNSVREAAMCEDRASGGTFLQTLSPGGAGEKLRGERTRSLHGLGPIACGQREPRTGHCPRMNLQSAQAPTSVSAEEQLVNWIVRSLGSTMAFRHVTPTLTAILDCPVDAALRTWVLMSESHMELHQRCLQWPLEWHLCGPEAGRRGLGSGDIPRMGGIWGSGPVQPT